MAIVPTSVMSLEDNILHLICEHVYHTSLRTVASLRLVDKRCYDVSLPFFYRSVLIWVGPNQQKHPRRPKPRGIPLSVVFSWPVDPQRAFIFNLIRFITILDLSPKPRANPPFEEAALLWAPVVDLVTRLTRLVLVRFRAPAPFPLSLLEATQKHHPLAKIEVLDWCRQDNKALHDDTAELALARSACLDTVSLHVHNSEVVEHIKAAFGRMISLAPNLKAIRFKETDDCYVLPLPEADLWADANDMPRQYSDLQTKQWMRFKDESPILKDIREFKLRGHFLFEDSFIDYWAKVIDFSKLESLDCGFARGHVPFFVGAAVNGLFKRLNHLNLDISQCMGSSSFKQNLGVLLEFVRSCAPLQSLGLYGCNVTFTAPSQRLASLPDWLSNHVGTLRSLSLHASDSWRRGHGKPRALSLNGISLEELRYLRDSCRELRILGVDVYHSPTGEEEERIYAMLATFPYLQRIELHFDIELALCGVERVQWLADVLQANQTVNQELQIVDAAFVQRLWNIICTRKVGQPLQGLAVKVGNGRSIRLRRGQRHYRMWVATRSEGDGADGQSFVQGLEADPYEDIHRNSFECS